jgi:hypothetical protein
VIPEGRPDDQELVAIKIRRGDLRVIKMIAAHLEMTMADYIGHLLRRASREDLNETVLELEGFKAHTQNGDS